MASLDQLRDTMPEYARDLKVNLQSVLGEGSLTEAQRLGVALACAAASRNSALVAALEAETRQKVGDAVAEDARAAAALMGMTNVFYRFRHLVGREEYSQLPARLRMQRIAKPAWNKLDFELFCLAVSAVNACEACVRAHEHTVREGGLGEAQVHDAIRIAATVHGAAVALDSFK